MKTTPIGKTFLLFQSLGLPNGKIYPNFKLTPKKKKYKKKRTKKKKSHLKMVLIGRPISTRVLTFSLLCQQRSCFFEIS